MARSVSESNNRNYLESLRAKLLSPEPRSGSAADRGKVLHFDGKNAQPTDGRYPLGKVIPGIIAGAADLDPAAVMTATVSPTLVSCPILPDTGAQTLWAAVCGLRCLLGELLK